MVTNNAAAALGVPLAIDLAEKMGLSSPHPLAMPLEAFSQVQSIPGQMTQLTHQSLCAPLCAEQLFIGPCGVRSWWS